MKIYISGPMTGKPDLNREAFERAAMALRGKGYEVINPHDIEQPVISWAACMRQDIKALMDADAIAMLTGWEDSNGARIEFHLAHKLGMKIVYL